MLVGPFAQFGHSRYETHNDFSSGHVKGDGRSTHYGLGLLAHWDGVNESHPYIEGSVLFGRNKNKFDNDLGADYEVSANYWGFGAGVGYIASFGASSVDVYAKYIFTRLGSTSATLSTGEYYRFEAVTSAKTKLGLRYSYEQSTGKVKWAPFIGAAWQKEFKGSADATTNGYAVEAPSLKGSSGVAEIGVSIDSNSGLKAELGLVGFTGKQRGINANIMLQYLF